MAAPALHHEVLEQGGACGGQWHVPEERVGPGRRAEHRLIDGAARRRRSDMTVTLLDGTSALLGVPCWMTDRCSRALGATLHLGSSRWGHGATESGQSAWS